MKHYETSNTHDMLLLTQEMLPVERALVRRMMELHRLSNKHLIDTTKDERAIKAVLKREFGYGTRQLNDLLYSGEGGE